MISIKEHLTHDVRQPAFSLLALAGFLLVYSINAYFNYSCAMVNDILIYARTAKALLHGHLCVDYPVFFMLKKHFPSMVDTLTPFDVNSAGYLVSRVTIGITLMFAPFIALFGDRIFWIIPVAWDGAMILGLYFTVRYFFATRLAATAWIAALTAVAAYGTIINFRLNLRRDMACEALLSVATLCIMMALTRKKLIWWHAAFGLLCFMSIIKLNMVMLFVPCAMIFVHEKPWKGMRARTVLRHLAVAAIIAAAVFFPFFIQNHGASGHWYKTVQGASLVPGDMTRAKENVIFKAGKSFIRTGRDQSYIYSPKGLPPWCAIPFVAIAIAGMWAQRRQPFVLFWAIPCVVLLYLFYTVWNISWRDYAFTTNIYLAPAYPLMVFFFVCGVYSLGGALIKREAVAWSVAAVFLIPFLGVKIYYSMPDTRHERFRLPNVAGLKEDLLRHIPPGSVLLCDRYLNYVVDYFTPIYSFPPAWLEDSASTAVDKVGYLLDKKVNVYFCDYRGVEGSAAYRQRLAAAFELQTVEPHQDLHRYPSVFPAPPFSIYKINGMHAQKADQSQK